MPATKTSYGNFYTSVERLFALRVYKGKSLLRVWQEEIKFFLHVDRRNGSLMLFKMEKR